MTEAPRWRLMSAHYLKVEELPDGTRIEWEHKETNRTNGRTIRRLYSVPMLLEPKDPADHNYPGEIIVAHRVDGASNVSQDIIFHGEPTQEMEPLNEAAQAISDSLRQKWIDPVNSLPIKGDMTADEERFMQSMMKAFSRTQQPVAVPNDEVAELRKRLAELEALMVPKPEAPAATARRV